MVAKKKPEPSNLERAARKILERKGTQNFDKWKEDTIAKQKFAILQGQATEWEKEYLETVYLTLVMESITEN